MAEDDAMSTRIGRPLIWGLGVPTILLSLTTIVSHSFGRMTYGLLLPAIEDDLGLDHTAAGVAGTAIYLAYLVGVVVVIVLAPRVEPITLMKGGLLLAAVGLALLAGTDSYPMLLVGLALAGGAGAGIWMTAPVLATTGVSPDRRGAVIGLLSASIGLSGFLLGLGTRTMRSAFGDPGLWRPVWIVECVLALALAAGIMAFVRFERTEQLDGRFDISSLKKVPGWARITVAYALFGVMSSGFGSFVIAALEDDGGLSRASATTVFSVMGLFAALGAPVNGALSDRFGRPRLMIFTMTVLVVACISVALGEGWVVAVGAVLYGSMAGSFPAILATYVRDHIDQRAFSSAFATMTLLFSVVVIAVPGAVGALADRTGQFTVPYLLLALAGVGSLVTVAGLPRTPPPLS